MKNRHALPIAFVFISSLVLTLAAYLLITKTTFHLQFFITACGEVLRNIQDHVHFNLEGALSSFILFVTIISISLALVQLAKFIASHRGLHKFQIEKAVPNKLRAIINKHNLSSDSVAVVKNYKLTAYTIGLFKPKIIISKAMIAKLSLEQLEAVVLHELYHLRNRHLLWLLLSRLTSSLFFFIPVVEYLARELRTEFELEADNFVVEKQKTRDHLCGSLALNIQYAGGVIPHFATTPIERRINHLLGEKLSFERIGIRQLSISLFSLGVMLGTAFVQPNQVAADFTYESREICLVEEGCQSTDCSGYEINNTHSFSPVVPASFSLLVSH